MYFLKKKEDVSNLESNITVNCVFKDCYQCCLETEMLLTNEDLERIESHGFKRENFCLPQSEVENFWQLKNIENRCFFLSKNGKCKIYDYRPVGCRVYPLIVDVKLSEFVIDNECREQLWFSKISYNHEQLEAVSKLVNTLIAENDEYFDNSG